MNILMEIYEMLRRSYSPQQWWPVTPTGGREPEYTGGPKSITQRFEVAVGAVLTQNTAWANAAKAIENLNAEGIMNQEALSDIDERTLAEMIRPAGYFNQKAKRLKILAAYFCSSQRVTRSGLLELNGVGPETADSILLYAFNRPRFVVDAYTRRIFTRVGIISGNESYDDIRSTFEKNLPHSARLYQEYHALIVEHGKRICRRKPLCGDCTVSPLCRIGRRSRQGR
jgi:endonuclease-3 related protein